MDGQHLKDCVGFSPCQGHVRRSGSSSVEHGLLARAVLCSRSPMMLTAQRWQSLAESITTTEIAFIMFLLLSLF